MPQQIKIFQLGKEHLRYLLHLPPDYEQGTTKQYPMILFLHGIGERGSDPNVLKAHGIPRVVEEKPDFPFITISPQCPDGTMWNFKVEALIALLDDVINTYRIDPRRVYLTGLSMGGYGSWALGSAYPDRFAAVAPICGGGDEEAVCALKNTPVWAFHGKQDNLVLFRESRKLVDALKACGGKVRFTIYPNGGHDVWTVTYNNQRLYDWFLSYPKA